MSGVRTPHGANVRMWIKKSHSLVQSEFGRFSRPESQLLPLNGKQLGPSYPPNRAFFKREIAMKVTSDSIIAMKVTSDSIIDAFNTVKKITL